MPKKQKGRNAGFKKGEKASPGSKKNNGNKKDKNEETSPLVGTYHGSNRRGVVFPSERSQPRKIKISSQGGRVRAREGDKVLVHVTRRPAPGHRQHRYPAEGKITEVIGPAAEPGIDITSIQRKYGLPTVFPAKVLKEVESLEESHIASAARQEERLDLRDLPTVTIDGADAKDLDDAVSLERKSSGGYRLGVHIADVSYYIHEGGAVDREAAKRATSVYLPDRVIPMLPPRLSNHICSLNPSTDRLAVSVFMDVDEKGELESYRFSPSIIRSDERMTYEAVNSILEGEDHYRKKYAPFVQTFEDMAALARAMREKRIKRGALDFEFPEAKVVLDEQGRPLEISVSRPGLAESIIEEFMLYCNGVIATHFHRLGVPFIYRVHERPDMEKLLLLRDFLTLFNIKLQGDLRKLSPRFLQEIMGRVKDTGHQRIVHEVILRSLPQARYSESPLGHFGLATRYYTHFTSPIRRYPDLLVHRILRITFKGEPGADEKRRLAGIIPGLAQHSSEQERIAMEAERECLDLKKVEFMQGKEGEEYDGIISGVTNFGIFIELHNTVEGLIHVTEMQDDYYRFDEKRYTLTGERGGKVYRLGDEVRVRLEKVDKESRTINFSLV